MIRAAPFSTLAGAGLVVLYTVAITASDAFTKHLAASFEAPQVLVICAGTILALSLAAHARVLRGNASAPARSPLKTAAPWAMALRAAMTVLAAIFFYYAFASLPFADVFLFIALVPIIAGLLSAPVLGERVAPLSWLALGLGALGVFLLFPEGRADMTLGHGVALAGAFCGTLAIVMARYIARIESAPLALVFWPQLAIFASMGLAAPFVWQPIGWGDFGLAALCGVALFCARYALVVALQVLPAYTATPLINLQFVWMVLVGLVVFDEAPAAHTMLGAAIIVATGLLLVWEQHARHRDTPDAGFWARLRDGMGRSGETDAERSRA